MSKNLYAIVLSLTAILYSTNCIYAYTGTDPGWFDEITDVYDNGMTYNLSNKTINSNPTSYGNNQFIRIENSILFLSYYSNVFNVVDAETLKSRPDIKMNFDDVRDRYPVSNINSIGYDSNGNLFAVSISGSDTSSYIYNLECTSENVNITKAYPLTKECDWYLYIPAVYGDITTGNFTILSAVRAGNTDKTYPRLNTLLVRWSFVNGVETNRESVQFATTMSMIHAIDSERIIIDDVAPSNRYWDIIDNPDYPSTPTFLHWPAGKTSIEKITSIEIEENDSLNCYGMTFRIFSYGDRDFIVYCVDGLRPAYSIATLRDYPDKLEIGQVLWTFPSSDVTLGSYEASPTDEHLFPDINIHQSTESGTFEITLATEYNIALYEFTIKGGKIAPVEAEALDVSLKQAYDNSLPVFDIMLSCNTTETANKRLSETSTKVDRLLLIAGDKNIANQLNLSSSASSPKFVENDFNVTDGTENSIIHGFGAEIPLDDNMRRKLESSNGISFTWSDIDPSQKYLLKAYIIASDTEILQSLNLRQGIAKTIHMEYPEAARVGIHTPSVNIVSLGGQTLPSRYTDINTISSIINVSEYHSKELENKWNIRHFLTIGNHNEFEIVPGRGTISGLSASDENCQIKVRTVFSRKTDGLQTETTELSALALNYPEFLPSANITTSNSFLIYGNKDGAPDGTTVYDAIINYNVEFFDPIESSPAAYVDYDLTVNGRDSSHAGHIGGSTASAFEGRIITANEAYYSEQFGSIKGLEGYDGTNSPARQIALCGHAPIHIHHICCVKEGSQINSPISLDADFKVIYPILSFGNLTYTPPVQSSYKVLKSTSAADDSASISEYTISSGSVTGDKLKVSTGLTDDLFDHVTTGMQQPLIPTYDDNETIYTIDGKPVRPGTELPTGMYIRVRGNKADKIFVNGRQ